MNKGARLLTVSFILIFACCCAAAADTASRFIKIHFLYGSKPAKGYEGQETKWFGGFHGGHVSIEVDNEVIGFAPMGKLHVFARRKKEKFHCSFQRQEIVSFSMDSLSLKYATVTIPVTEEQYLEIKNIHSAYLAKAPYDYAFFGMRCAAATYDILSQLDLVKHKSRFGNIIAHFYPKPLRKKIFRIAKERGYEIRSQPGRPTRKWEKDHWLGKHQP